MPNWCTNKLILTGDSKVIKGLIGQIFDKNEFFNLVIPRLELDDWDEDENWGSDRDIDIEDQLINADELRDFLKTKSISEVTTVSMVFYSAWTPPLKVYEKLNELGIDVYAVYWELGSLFCGYYANGEEQQQRITGYCSDLPSYILEVKEAFEDFPLGE